MKQLLCVALLCALILPAYQFHQPSIDGPPFYPSPTMKNQILSRRLGKELSVLESKLAREKKDKIRSGMKKSEAKVGSVGGELGDDEEGGLIYNADYHGVITHPSPLPKHPRP